MAYEGGSEIYGEGEPVEYIYKVLSGAVRTYKLLSDGRRQIGAFHLPGEFFGLEAAADHQFSAEAISECEIMVVKRSAVFAMAGRDASVARELWSLTAADLARAQDHMLLLGRKSAAERVATFLLEMSRRASVSGTVELPMSRQDIADYLGLTIETVSRTISQFVSSAFIQLASSRRIVVRNPVALRRLDA
ncbi:MAG: helix-turn-helix domain-containing protein [Bauldia sp.]|nr:helix-turn-helix domain-containing protein [Bauldia sp.]